MINQQRQELKKDIILSCRLYGKSLNKNGIKGYDSPDSKSFMNRTGKIRRIATFNLSCYFFKEEI